VRISTVKTTLNIDADALAAAKRLARDRSQSTGGLISDRIRSALASKATLSYRNGIPLLPMKPGSARATLKLVNQLRDD